jgi:hypothetical protein
MAVTITNFFKHLGAPLKNLNWSWGAQRKEDGTIFLRVWNDETRKDGRGEWAQVAWRVGDFSSSPGHNERMKHLELVQSGAPCFLVLLDADDITAKRRTIRRYEDRIVGVGGEIKTDGDKTWIHIVRMKLVSEVLLPKRAS